VSNLDWRPIATAPADEDIMVFSARWGALIAEYSSEYGQWFPRMQCPVALHGEADGVSHWMPLPAAPETHRAPVSGLKFTARVGNEIRVSA
jgi:hypothetical protein